MTESLKYYDVSVSVIQITEVNQKYIQNIKMTQRIS